MLEGNAGNAVVDCVHAALTRKTKAKIEYFCCVSIGKRHTHTHGMRVVSVCSIVYE